MIYLFEWIFGIFLLYSIVKIIRRKLCKPNYVGKTVWITGASSGIGQYLAYQFSKHGASLILSARNNKQLQRVKQNCQNKEQVKIVVLDMTDYQAVEKVTKDVISDLQQNNLKLDVVVENAGVSMRAQFKDYHFKNHIDMFNVNIHGPTLHIKCLLDHMIKNKSGQIVGISSVQGKLATCYRSSYAGTKHALIGILDSLRAELTRYGIKITNIMPGYIFTNVSKNSFGAGAGQKFGETDLNIQKGMRPQDFSRQAVKTIYMQQNQAQISNQPIVPIGLILRNICPDLAFLGLRLNQKNQTKAIKRSQ